MELQGLELGDAAKARLPVYKESFDLTPHAFAEVVHDAWYYTPLQTKNGFGQVEGDFWVVGDWLISDCHLPPSLNQAEKDHVRNGSTTRNLERLRFGNERGREENDQNLLLATGEIQCAEIHQCYEAFATERRSQDVTLPRAQLGISEDPQIEFPVITEKTAIGQLACAEWDEIFAALNRGDRTLSQRRLDRLAACIKIAMGTHAQREDVRVHARDALFRQICRFVERNLENASPSTNTLLDQFGVSRATLYRMFEPLGGVRNYVTERRAMSALFYISNHDGRRGFVQAACERWGFSSPANFNRTIQRLFGNSPKALLFAREKRVGPPLSLTEFVQDAVAVRYQGEGDAIPVAA